VATPIGNLGDMSPRAIETLRGVDHIAAEDTRHSRPLLQHFGITTSMVSLHEHNEREQCQRILGWLAAGQSVALISDAGTPLISDPGYHVVRQAREQGLAVVPVPGPSALIAALSVAGLPTDRFVFEGFLSAKGAARRSRLEALARETRTLVFYESSHRIGACLEDMAAVLGGGREALLARELTKAFETVRSDTLDGLVQWVAGDADQRRGEFVVVVRGADETLGAEEAEQAAEQTLGILLAEGLSVRQAAAVAARLTGGSRNRLYKRALELAAGESGDS